MNIALIGYGKMGKEIEKIALERGHSISLKVTRANADYTAKDLSDTDVAIEFSVPQAAKSNILKCFEANVPVAIGTTAWYDDFDTVKEVCLTTNQTMLYASNFSLGVNIFFNINEKIAQIMNQHNAYKVDMEEIHHTQKLDAPSGTAITTAEKILSNIDRLSEWKLEGTESETTEKQLEIKALREPDVPGTHTVRYESDIDILEFKHEAKNRKGFALGSVLAAEFIVDKKGIFTMNDLLGL